MSDSKVETEKDGGLAGKVLLGEYRIERMLGSGGMSHVYLAHQLSVDRPVVVKVMIPPSVDVERWKGRFMREARAASKIRHRGVVTIYSFGEEEGVGPFIAMEYVTGQSLRELINDHAPLTPRRAARLVAQACRALHAAHEMGVIHRDLKPDNLMIDVEDGQEHARVLDFGVAKAPDALVDTLDGHVVGTPAYMAPEQARNQELDARADVYAMGIILFELLDGKRPFEAPTAVSMMLKHVQEPLPLDRLAWVPDSLLAALTRACCKSVDERWESAAEFAEALERIETELGAVETPAELGAVDTDDVSVGPHTPEPVPTLDGPPPSGEPPVRSTHELADVTAGDLAVVADGGARLAMGVSIAALALAVVAVAFFVGDLLSDSGSSDVPQNSKDLVFELLDAGERPDTSGPVTSERDPSDSESVEAARLLVFDARAEAGRAAPEPAATEGRPAAPKSESSDGFELLTDPTKEKGAIISPFEDL